MHTVEFETFFRTINRVLGSHLTSLLTCISLSSSSFILSRSPRTLNNWCNNRTGQQCTEYSVLSVALHMSICDFFYIHCVWLYVRQELEKARAIIAARLASKDGNVADPASATGPSVVDAMSLIVHGYESDSEEEEGEIEYSKMKCMEKKAKLRRAAEAMEDAGHPSLTTTVSQASDDAVHDATASLPANNQPTDDHSQQRAPKSESRSSDDHKSHRKKGSSRDHRERDRHDSTKNDPEKSRRDSKHENTASRQDREKYRRRSGNEKVSNSQGATDQRQSHKSRERELAKELSQKSESEQRTSSKDSKVDGHRQRSSKLQEISGQFESDRTTESDKRHSDPHHGHSSTRHTSPDVIHMPSHSKDRKAER